MGARRAARKTLMDGSDEAGLTAILTGLGSLSYGELAGERMKLGLMIHDPEEEHDCFSDNTFASHYFDALGIRNVYLGRYRRADGSVVQGPSVSDLVKAKAPDVDAETRAKLDATLDVMTDLYRRGVTIENYDQMIGEGNEAGNAMVQHAIDALLDQTKSFERGVAALDSTCDSVRRLRQLGPFRQGGRGAQSGRRQPRSPVNGTLSMHDSQTEKHWG